MYAEVVLLLTQSTLPLGQLVSFVGLPSTKFKLLSLELSLSTVSVWFNPFFRVTEGFSLLLMKLLILPVFREQIEKI